MQLPAGAANPITQPQCRGTLSDLYDDLAARATREELFGQARVESGKLPIHTKRVRDRTDASAGDGDVEVAPAVPVPGVVVRHETEEHFSRPANFPTRREDQHRQGPEDGARRHDGVLRGHAARQGAVEDERGAVVAAGLDAKPRRGQVRQPVEAHVGRRVVVVVEFAEIGRSVPAVLKRAEERPRHVVYS